MNTFDFSAGLDLVGSWENLRTGEVINIRDTVMMDNQLIGVTTDGRQIPFEKLQSFVKSEDQKPTRAASAPAKRKPAARPSKPFVDDVDRENNWGKTAEDTNPDDFGGYEILPEDQNLLRKPFNAKPEAKQAPAKPKVDPAITKVLEGLSPKETPVIDINVKWDSIPEGVVFLKKYLNVSEEDLTAAIIDKYIDMKEVQGKLSEKLTKIIDKGLNPPAPKKEKAETKKSGS